MKITFANSRVEKFFTDYGKMKKALPAAWVRTIKMHMDWLESAECFGDYLSLGLGRPEQLSGYRNIRYSVRISANARLILEPDTTQETIMVCTEIEVEGVSDYHGDKEDWYIP